MVSPSQTPRILVIRPGALGDIILTIPMLQAIRAGIPSVHLELMAGSAAADLLLPRRIVDCVHSADPPGLHTFFSETLEPDPKLSAFFRAFDWVLSYWADQEGIFQRQLQWCVRGRLLCHPPHPPSGSKNHAATHLAGPLAEMGLSLSIQAPRLRSTDTERAMAEKVTREFGLPASVPLVLLHPGSGSHRKNWPATCFAELGRMISGTGKARCVFIEGPADAFASAEVRRALLPEKFPWLVSPTLGTLLALLEGAKAYVGNDSGVSHLAGAAGSPSLVLFGPTAPEVWQPLGPNVTVLHRPQGLHTLSVDEVFQKLAGLLVR